MSVAYELEFETYRPRLYVLPDQPARTAPSPRVRRRRVVLARGRRRASCSSCWPCRSAPSAAARWPRRHRRQGQEYIVKAGDTLASIAARADPAHAASLTGQLARETGSSVVVPGEHIFIP